MKMNQFTAGRRTTMKALPPFLRNRRVLLCIIGVLLILLLVVFLVGRSAQKARDEAYITITDLNNDITRLEQEKAALQEEAGRQTALAKNAAEANVRLARAMDLFWQIDEAYALGRNTRARELIAILETEALAGVLPQESTTNNGRFSPYHRYEEICVALGESYGNGM